MICFSSFVVLIIEMELETFKITVLPLRQKMLNFSQRLVEDTAEAEDVVQEAFIKLWYIREKLDAYHSVEALAMQVTKNLSLDKIKLRKPQGSELESVTLVSDAVSPDEQLEQRDAAECIRHLIAQLPALQQTIIRMKDVEGYELAEIAEITATPVENVRVNPPVKRRVLAHDTDEILVFREVLFDPVQEPDRIILCPRKDHMADDDAAVQHGRALLIPGKSAGEADHFFYRGGSFLKIVRSGRVFF